MSQKLEQLARDEAFMARALALAERGTGWTSPNPLVGAVIVKDGRIIGEGWHTGHGGQPHAEREALAACDEDPAGSTLYVTLEPCCHWGKTPPCTDAILEAGIARVVVGALDPNPLVAGQGCAQLREAGTVVETGVLEEGVPAPQRGILPLHYHRAPLGGAEIRHDPGRESGHAHGGIPVDHRTRSARAGASRPAPVRSHHGGHRHRPSR